jgi:hypothetical protein
MGSSSVSGRWGTLVFVGALAVGAFLIGNALSGVDILRRGEKYSEVGQPVVNRVRDIAALTTVEVVESATIEKGNDFGWLNWARGDRVFMFVVAKIGAGIDFERFYTESFEVDKESGTVTVRMPPAHITYVAIDNSQTQVIDRSTGVFTTGDPKLETDARQVAEKVLRNAAIDAGILERAEKNARTLIEGLLLELGYTRVLFTPPSVTTLSHAIPFPPQVEGRSCNPKVSAGLIDVPDALGVLKDSLLSMNLSLIVGHSDLLGHHLL